MSTPAILALADGSLFYGTAIGADGETSGEVVFNTAMTGYQEILTDPSYARQLVTLTYPHIGNTGVNPEDVESDRVHAAALIIRDLPLAASNWRSTQSLDGYLRDNNVVGIADIDTRRLTRILRDKGSQSGAVVAGESATAERALELAQAFPGLKGMDLAKEVSSKDVSHWTQTEWDLVSGYGQQKSPRFKIVAYDYGIKLNILRMLASRGCDITVVPAQTPAAKVLAMNPDGVFLSNGPGDPEPCDYAIKAIQDILETDVPVFGICLGYQLLALASGAKTMKMNHGHHGANHPVQCLADGTVMITSQNHGFAVDEASLPANLEATHKSLFDGTLQGLRRTDKAAFSFQGHPEASPGPHDVAPLFDEFIRSMEARRA
ncbi:MULTISPECIES: glutamine-hydrolyzing carbamoyl-phosphate synthase small subunit [unclassified Marinobacter]|uniref:glutamine-hydrolyzing carbamoyl-phosphate synthase small subunit n=1 Tax=unclassified Marinobacter TaxID=83889 RepID=UPI00200D1A1F|nr:MULTISPECIES: glutamine-hydrolyzing carbamoyl-phosphate synthase small subunit [unclassified Marinobacter]UQG55498.1 glutamine-hydrolyzing carbamoyl-phosphate synthase small subunit [Marinobacter sp. M4C]UQG64302.1 glutamine-hydrolyzing carbamoyl-phosphate synthase small subunit [Marinobacter sp. M2C]UQG68581.1 glutamine-hydrolyzing carbamoyl-phosphate synthase small subunit [Marinobacter sp. M1C]